MNDGEINMKISVEQYGDQIGVDGTIAKLLKEKKIQLLLTLKSDDNRECLEFVLNKQQAEKLAADLRARLDDPELAKNGFVVV